MSRELVVRSQHGDREAFTLLAGEWIARLRAIAQLMVNDRDLADDAVQETLVLAWRDIRGLREPDAFGAWLHRILVHCAVREARRERRAIGLSLVMDDRMQVPAGLEDAADRDEIDRGFRRLTPEHRAVLVLHFYLGFSERETAAILGVPPGTVKSRLNRALASLRAALDAEARLMVRLEPGGIR